MSLPKPVIPLDIALSPTRLAAFLAPEGRDQLRVVVFGLSHSGTLVLRNVREAGCGFLTGVYRGTQPFYWFRYGHTEGLKQDSAVIADAIVAREWGSATPALLRFADFEAVASAVICADYVVYAVGFDRRAPVFQDARGAFFVPKHDPATCLLAPNCWGFGIGFPGEYVTNTGDMAPDVGFGGFVAAIQKNLQTILN
jgi:hypothetical protein